MRRRLLVISFHFPPDGAVGGLRWSGLTKYLARRGWEVHVVTAAIGADQSHVEGVMVHVARRSRTLNDRYASWRNRRSMGTRGKTAGVTGSQGAPPTQASAAAGLGRRLITWARLSLSSVLMFPDGSRGWVLRAARVARRLVREHRFDAIVSSGPAHSGHLVAAAAASVARPSMLLIDMRDPWVSGAERFVKGTMHDFVGLQRLLPPLERYVFRRADRIVANTRELSDVLRGRFPEISIFYLPNGIDPERLPPPAQKKFDEMTIAYAGALYFNRDLAPVAHAIGRFLATHPEARGALKLRVAGQMNDDHAARLWKAVHDEGVQDSIEILGNLSPAAALDLVNRSHIALVLAQGQAIMVPAKLYECVAMRIVTLVITEPTSATAREAYRIGAIICDPGDIPGIQAVLERLWVNRDAKSEPLDAMTYDVLAERMDALLQADPR